MLSILPEETGATEKLTFTCLPTPTQPFSSFLHADVRLFADLGSVWSLLSKHYKEHTRGGNADF